MPKLLIKTDVSNKEIKCWILPVDAPLGTAALAQAPFDRCTSTYSNPKRPKHCYYNVFGRLTREKLNPEIKQLQRRHRQWSHTNKP